jgi:hypothetical protein
MSEASLQYQLWDDIPIFRPRKRLTRVFHQYQLWEDYQNGMFKNGMRESKILESIKMLTDKDILYDAMTYVSRNWKFAAEVNLTNRGGNRQAWLGQAACNYLTGATEYETRRAWGIIVEPERIEANSVADRVIEEWEQYYLGGGVLSNVKKTAWN